MKRWHVRVGGKELECVLSRGDAKYYSLVLIADEKIFVAQFDSLDEFQSAKNGNPESVTVHTRNKSKEMIGLAVFKEVNE